MIASRSPLIRVLRRRLRDQTTCALRRLSANANRKSDAAKVDKTAFLKARSSERLWSNIPPRMHVVGSDAVSLIVKHLGDDRDVILCESSPGPGFLTSKLLASGFSHVHLFENKTSEYLSALEVTQMLAVLRDNDMTCQCRI